jgi:hypothetical protein
MIDLINQVRTECGHLIGVTAQRDAELQAEEDQEEIDLAKTEAEDLDITTFAEAWEGLSNIGPLWHHEHAKDNTIQINSSRCLHTEC